MINQELINKTIIENEGVLNALSKAIGGTPSELKDFLTVKNKKNIFHIDGGARGNPGTAGCGIVMEKDNLKSGYYFYIGETTNNVAEYLALEYALKIAEKENIKDVLVYSDSELVTKQVNGIYKVKNENLKEIFNRVNILIKKFNTFSIVHIRRENNKDADKLANIAMDLMKNGKTELTVAL